MFERITRLPSRCVWGGRGRGQTNIEGLLDCLGKVASSRQGPTSRSIGLMGSQVSCSRPGTPSAPAGRDLAHGDGPGPARQRERASLASHLGNSVSPQQERRPGCCKGCHLRRNEADRA